MNYISTFVNIKNVIVYFRHSHSHCSVRAYSEDYKCGRWGRAGTSGVVRRVIMAPEYLIVSITRFTRANADGITSILKDCSEVLCDEQISMKGVDNSMVVSQHTATIPLP